jgi:hypothetical protein
LCPENRTYDFKGIGVSVKFKISENTKYDPYIKASSVNYILRGLDLR